MFLFNTDKFYLKDIEITSNIKNERAQNRMENINCFDSNERVFSNFFFSSICQK